MQVLMPQYFDGLSEEQESVCRARFLIRLAALYYSTSGQLNVLGEALGLHPNTLAGLDEVSPQLAVKIERLLGRERFPRQLLRPDLFLTEA